MIYHMIYPSLRRYISDGVDRMYVYQRQYTYTVVVRYTSYTNWIFYDT